MRVLGPATFLSGVVALRLLVLSKFYPVLIESDEAIVGLMARHILGGHIPVFFYGQSYMGALEAYMTAVAFSLFGASALVMKFTVLALFLAFLVVHFKLAEEVSGSLKTAWLATISLGISPAFLTVWSLKSRGGYMSLLLCGTMSLLLTTVLLKDESNRKLKLFILGAFLGAAFWADFLAVAYVVPIGLVLIWRLKARLLRDAWVGGIGFFITSLPVWVYNLIHPLASFDSPFTRRTTLVEDFRNVLGTGLPILFGGRAPWTGEGGYFPFSGILVVVLFLGAFVWVGKVQLCEKRSYVSLLLFFVFLFPLFISAAAVGHFMIEPRYLLPLYSAVYILLFMAFPRFPIKVAVLVVLVALNLYGSLTLTANQFIIPGYTQPLQPLIEFLHSEKVRYAYAPYWIAYRLSFESGETIICSPPPSDHIRYGQYIAEIRRNEPATFIQVQSSPSHANGSIEEIPADYVPFKVGDFDVFLPPDRTGPVQ